MTFADFPFLRYLFFFFGGALLTALIPQVSPSLFLRLLTLIWLIYLGHLNWSPSPNPFLSSSLAYLLLIGLGCYVSLLSRQEALAGDIPWEEGKGYLAEVQRYDVPKANSSENLLAVVAIQGAEGWQTQKSLVLVNHQLEEALYPGQVIWVPSNPERIAPPSFPNEFNYKRFLAAKGIHFRQFLGKKVKQAYSATGTQHILAVSGLHVGIIYSILLLPLTFFKQEGHALRKSYLFLVLGLIWIYALMTGFSPSVVRAVVMFSLVTLGQMRKRKPSIWNILAFSALLLLVLDPDIQTDLGFQLSYLAVAGIVGLQPILLRMWAPSNRVLDYFWQMATVTLAAQLITSPLTLHYFHTFPTYFLVANGSTLDLGKLGVGQSKNPCLVCFGAWVSLGYLKSVD